MPSPEHAQYPRSPPAAARWSELNVLGDDPGTRSRIAVLVLPTVLLEPALQRARPRPLCSSSPQRSASRLQVSTSTEGDLLLPLLVEPIVAVGRNAEVADRCPLWRRRERRVTREVSLRREPNSDRSCFLLAASTGPFRRTANCLYYGQLWIAASQLPLSPGEELGTKAIAGAGDPMPCARCNRPPALPNPALWRPSNHLATSSLAGGLADAESAVKLSRTGLVRCTGIELERRTASLILLFTSVIHMEFTGRGITESH